MQLNTNSIVYNRDTERNTLQYCVGGLLYMPATQDIIKQLSKPNNNIHSICLDFEDSLGTGIYARALESLKKSLKSINEVVPEEAQPLIFIRVRNAEQVTDIVDYLYPHHTMITGLIFPKFDTTTAQAYVTAFHQVSGDIPYFMPIFESKKISYTQLRIKELTELHQILDEEQEHVLNVRIGGTDFMGLFGLRRNNYTPIYKIRIVNDIITDILNLFSRDYVVSGPVWEYFNGDSWDEGLKQELNYESINGIIGKTCIHPNQLSYILSSLQPSTEDYNDALQILSVDRTKLGVVSSTNRSRMNEIAPHYNWAQRIVNLARIYGTKE